MDMTLSELQELVMDRGPGVLQSMGSQRVGHDRLTELTVRGEFWATQGEDPLAKTPQTTHLADCSLTRFSVVNS